VTVCDPKHFQADNPTRKWLPNWRWLHSKWAGLLIVAALFIFMAALSWRKWADPVVDFGMQLYVPWRLSVGDVLYRDVMYLPGGPLSQYFNALLFKIFGVSVQTIIFANLTITAAMLAVIYRCFLAATDRWTATTICSAIVMGFAFADYTDANYNYITPYSHEAFHGLVLSILGIACMSRWIKNRRWLPAAGAGFCCGLVFLTKPDIFVALSAAMAIAFFLAVRNGAGGVLKSFIIILFAAAAPPLFFFFYFLHSEDVWHSLTSTAYAWVPLLKTSLASDYYYRRGMGLDHPMVNLGWNVVEFSLLAVLVALHALLFRRKTSLSKNQIALLVVSVPVLAVDSYMNWLEIGQMLPLTVLALCVLLFAVEKKILADERRIFPILWSTFALLMLSKMGLNCRIWHYGFALAMPAFVCLIYLLLWLTPLWLEKYGVQRLEFRRLTWWFLIFGCLQLSGQSAIHYAKITFPVGNGGDEIKTANTDWDQRGLAISIALSQMKTNLPPHATLAVVPEGAMVNYLSRRVNPTGYPVCLPPEMQAFGQTNMIAAFERHSPDYIILIHRSVSEYNLKYFGQQPQYGLAMMRWIRQNYDVVFQEGDVPLQTWHFGLQILKRN
jgi:hypothetical protein